VTVVRHVSFATAMLPMMMLQEHRLQFQTNQMSLSGSVASISMMLRQQPPGLYEESVIKDACGCGYVRAQEDNVFKSCWNYPWFRELAASTPTDRTPSVIEELQAANAVKTQHLLSSSSWQRVGAGFWHIRIAYRAILTLDEEMELVEDSWGLSSKAEASPASQAAEVVAHQLVAHQLAAHQLVAHQLAAHRGNRTHSRGRPARLKRQQARQGTAKAKAGQEAADEEEGEEET